jgi:hypothetical protein
MKYMLWAGWVLSTLVVLALIMSAVFKFMQSEEILKEFVHLGYSEGSAVGLGILELACVVVYALPQTAVLGAILLTGYFGGAIATHVRISEGFVSPLVIGVLAWLGLYLREARLRALIPWRK